MRMPHNPDSTFLRTGALASGWLQTVSETVVVGGGDDDGRHWQLSFTEIYQLVLEGGAPVFVDSPCT